ncbi:hypothetical protein [uncultured Formosa sp.]|uniref:hypothetical protein n=1 Tax=uncultured Formosa sp. TaxID=255435 RepID=UPI00260FC0D9|nr:hypothetical protein [uncultured Formosa sp.]
MKKPFLIFTFLIASTFNLSAQNNSIPQTIAQQKAAKNIAMEWIKLFYEVDNTDALLNISKIPFAVSNEQILNSESELKTLYKKIINGKSEITASKISSEVYSSRYEIIDKCIPINVLIIMVTLVETDSDNETFSRSIGVSVELSGNNVKIIGLTDK